MKWFKSKKQKRIEELEAELAKVKELAYGVMPHLIDKANSIYDKVDDLRLVSPYRVENVKTETLCAKIVLPVGIDMLEEDVKARLAEKLTEGVSQYMITYNHYNPKDMEHEIAGYVKVVVCPDKTFYENRLIV